MLINAMLLKYLSYILKLFIQLLPNLIPVKEYNNLTESLITYYTLLNLMIDNYIQSFTSFLITSLSN